MTDLPLGKETTYADEYDPNALAAIPREQARRSLGIAGTLPFQGVDIWNAWELSWLYPGGKPGIAVAEIRVPADSPNIVESKSLKLYLNSFAMSTYDSEDMLRDVVANDLTAVTESPVSVTLISHQPRDLRIDLLPGACIDGLRADCVADDVNPDALGTIGDEVVEESLHSHLLRSLCPVTSQPDFGSVLINYRGRRLDTVGLLKYIVSFRRHTGFHEACVERMFVDIMARCECDKLEVYARFNRRGGIDINPFRSSSNETIDNLRLWRQ